MEWHEARLEAEPDERQGEHGCAPRRQTRAAERTEREPARPSAPEREHGDQRERPDVGGGEIDEPRPPDFCLLVLEHDEQVGSERHQFPSNQERHSRLGRHHEGHGSQKQAG